MPVDPLHLQLSSALHRLTALQRRAETRSSDPPKVLQQALGDLEQALEELRVAQEQLAEQRDSLEAMRHQLEAERRKYWDLFDTAPDAYLVTASDTRIVEANRAAAELLHISQRFLVGKPLTVFVCSERSRVLAQAMQLAQAGGADEWVFQLRPRERAPFPVAARVVAADDPEVSLRWLLRRVAPPVFQRSES